MAGVQCKSLIQFLEKTSDKYNVPIYQRKYTWNEHDISKFLSDIYNWYLKISNNESDDEDKNWYYAGSIITHNIHKSRSIVDGQQRITSTIIILSALKNISKESLNAIKEIDKLIFVKSLELNSEKSFRLKLNSPLSNGILTKISDPNSWFTKEEMSSQIYKNYLCICNQIKEYANDNSNYYDDIILALKNTMFTHVSLHDNDNPTAIFETINTTGQKLTPADIIKNYIFFYSYTLKNEESYIQRFEEIEKLICVDNDPKKHNDNLMTFYRYYNSIVFGKKLAKKGSLEIYELFKDGVNENKYNFENEDDINRILNDLKHHAQIWYIIHKYEPIKPKDKYFYNVFKDSIYTYYTLIHNLIHYELNIDNYQNNSDFNTKLNSIIRIIAKLIFSLLLSGKSEKQITRDIPNLYNNYRQSNSNLSFSDWMIDRFENNSSDIIILNKQGIQQYINNVDVYNFSEIKTKLLLYGIEGVLSNWEITQKYDENFKSLTVEHICPQNYRHDSDYFKYALEINDNDQNKADEYLKSKINKLFNLTLLLGNTNSEIQNKPYIEKIKIYHQKSNFIMNKELDNFSTWNKELLESRSKWLIDQIEKLFND